MQIVKFCKECRKRNINDLWESGYYNWLKDDCYICPTKTCGADLIDTCLNSDEFSIIIAISRDVDFLESMIALKEKDPIEFQLKLTQFKAIQPTKTEEQNIPKCPTCKSTNIKKISISSRWLSTGLFGLGSSKVGKTMECKNCGYKW